MGPAARLQPIRASVAGVWTEADRESSFARVSGEVSQLPAAEAAWGQHLRLMIITVGGFGG